jgi:hypothetical protein
MESGRESLEIIAAEEIVPRPGQHASFGERCVERGREVRLKSRDWCLTVGEFSAVAGEARKVRKNREGIIPHLTEFTPSSSGGKPRKQLPRAYVTREWEML